MSEMQLKAATAQELDDHRDVDSQVQIDQVTVDLDLLDEAMKRNLIALLSKKAKELSLQLQRPYSSVGHLLGNADELIVTLSAEVNALKALQAQRHQVELALQQELTLQHEFSPSTKPMRHLVSQRPHIAVRDGIPVTTDQGAEQALEPNNAAIQPPASSLQAPMPQLSAADVAQKQHLRADRSETTNLESPKPELRKTPAKELQPETTKQKPRKSKAAWSARIVHALKAIQLKRSSDTDTKTQKSSAQMAGKGANDKLSDAAVAQAICPAPLEEEPELEEGIFFSLERHYLESLKHKPRLVTKDAVIEVEVAVFRRFKLQDLHLVRAKGSFKLKQGWKKHAVVKLDAQNKHVVQIPPNGLRAIHHHGDQTTVLKPKQSCQLQLGEWIDLRDEQLHYLIRPVMAAEQVPFVETVTERIDWRKFYSGSAIGHLLVLITLGLLSLWQADTTPPPVAEFVQIDLSQLVEPPQTDPEPEAPTSEPKPEPKPAATPVEEKVADNAQVAVAPKPKPIPAPAKAEPPKDVGGGSEEGGNIVQRDIKATGLLAALGSTTATQPSSAAALAQVTNLDAVDSPNADSAALKVAGLSARVDGVRTSVPSGELLNTRGSAEVLRSGGLAGEGSIAALERGDAGTGAVRASVSATLSKQVKVQGGISRAEVKRVIDEHLSEVTFCYESALAYDANLSGKIVFEWTIMTSGRVSTVGIQSSTVQSDSLHNCIQAAIRSWQFPRPSGTEVIVSYPFVFDMVGF